ncbi:DUF3500 domain-containing protein [Nocardiopsis sp. Huas11]|uniref:DUF3500 domain-containing protein n=1 Tax=Nocardiopsis sp. Huas11 TaxID=2183912 RepID=UPI000EB14380|nr:DUF3500 domain-containing protein [Nocardiopsis sp. Huas11]
MYDGHSPCCATPQRHPHCVLISQQPHQDASFFGLARPPLEHRSRRAASVIHALAPLPEGPRRAKLREVRRHADDSWFSWIGGHAPGDVFYYRLQSPVLVAELDHHGGVFLDDDVPRRFHVHTVLRVPNGNDYGRSWVRQWRARCP